MDQYKYTKQHYGSIYGSSVTGVNPEELQLELLEITNRISAFQQRLKQYISEKEKAEGRKSLHQKISQKLSMISITRQHHWKI